MHRGTGSVKERGVCCTPDAHSSAAAHVLSARLLMSTLLMGCPCAVSTSSDEHTAHGHPEIDALAHHSSWEPNVPPYSKQVQCKYVCGKQARCNAILRTRPFHQITLGTTCHFRTAAAKSQKLISTSDPCSLLHLIAP